MITQKAHVSKGHISKVPKQVLAPLPPKFDWKVFKDIANVESIKNEDSAKTYFLKNAHINTQLRSKYFRKVLKIPDYLDEELYVDFLQNEYNVKMKNGEIVNDKLYAFYATQGKKIYPLKDSYFREYYKTPKEFDEELYKSIYQRSENSQDFIKELKKNNNIFELFYKNKEQYPISHNYLKIHFNIHATFDYDLYRSVYNLKTVELPKDYAVENFDVYEKAHIYNHCKNNSEFLNNPIYFKKYYNIPENFNEETYSNQYPEVKQTLTNVKNMQEKYEILNKIIIKNQLYYSNKYHATITNSSTNNNTNTNTNTNTNNNSSTNTNTNTNNNTNTNTNNNRITNTNTNTITNTNNKKKLDNHNFSQFYKFLYNTPKNLEEFLQNKTIEVEQYFREKINKLNIDQNIFINNFIDTSIIPINDITKYEFIKNNINEKCIYEFYNTIQHDDTSYIINNFNCAYKIINNSTYIKILRNRKKYYQIIEFCKDIFSINNSEDKIRGILCDDNIINMKLEDKCVMCANKYNIIYDSLIYIDDNISKLSSECRTNELNIEYIVPSNHFYHYAILIVNLLHLEKILLSTFNINIYGCKENNTFIDFENKVKHVRFIKMKYHIIENNKILENVYENNESVIFSSNILFNHDTNETVSLNNFKNNSICLAKELLNKINIYK